MHPSQSTNQKQIEFEAVNLDKNAEEPHSSKKQFGFVTTKCKSIDVEWEDLVITAHSKKKMLQNGKKVTVTTEKHIINNISGSIKHGKFTAIMGPSGCGKTTLLNFLSGRTDSQLKINGDLRVNTKSVNSIEFIGNLVAFVQQDDILLPTITPREVFNFTANLRLSLSKAERRQRVETLIKDLGLSKCADTKVGNNLIRGLSGGERKRTSIGVELITNPSLIFLDEPTTGLDSTTALHVLELLKTLAANGRNVVSTIHQPSSEIYNQFDNLLLMVRGNIIYQGSATHAVSHFGTIGYPCPRLNNPADFFMKLMNESGLILDEMAQNNSNKVIDIDQEALEAKFQTRVDDLVRGYNASGMNEALKRDITSEQIENKRHYQVSWIKQSWLIFLRSLINEFRNPLDVKSKFFQIVFLSIICIALYCRLQDSFTGIQNRIGLLFLCTTLSGMASITGSLGTFSLERPVYIRERLSKSYTSSAYFWGRATAELPILVMFPILLSILVYFPIGLNLDEAGKYFIFLAFHILGWFAGSGYGLFLSTIFPSLELAMALVPILVIPFLVFAGFFVNQNHIPVFLIEFEYLSVFKWLFQGTAINEFTDLTIHCAPGQACDALKTLDFRQPMWACFIALAGIGILFRIFAFLGLLRISTPKRAKLQRSVKKTNQQHEAVDAEKKNE